MREGRKDGRTETRTRRHELNGLEYLRAVAADQLPQPPLVVLLGFRLTVVDPGHVTVVGEPRESFYNGAGVIHGGWSAALLDTALGCAVNSMMPAGRAFTTLELTVNLTRPLRQEVGEVRCEANVLHVGNRVATAEARIVDSQGKLYAHATTVCILVERPAAR
jgi:uncharacterized protein (TIGR00369 family)